MEDRIAITQLEGNMGKIISHVPQLMAERGWVPMDLVRRSLISVQTAYRLARGETNIRNDTMKQLYEVFEVDSFDKIFEYVPDID